MTRSHRRSSGWPTPQVERQVWQGNFTYKNDNTTSARVDRIARYVTGRKGGKQLEEAAIIAPAAKDKRVKNPSNPLSWATPLWNRAKTVSRFVSNGAGATEGRLSDFRQFGAGQFFYSGWGSNPFTSNLI